MVTEKEDAAARLN